MDVLADGEWQKSIYRQSRKCLQEEEKRAWLDKNERCCTWLQMHSSHLVTILREHTRSGVKYIAQPGGSIRDDNVIETCNKI